MVKFLPKLLEDRDKNVREEAKLLVVEMYRWVGAAIKPKLVDFKPVQVLFDFHFITDSLPFDNKVGSENLLEINYFFGQ